MSGLAGHASEYDSETTPQWEDQRQISFQANDSELEHGIADRPLMTTPFNSKHHITQAYTSPSKRRSGPRREWDTVAARIAHRTANARNNAKRLSGEAFGTDRVVKSTTRRHRPGLSIDTNVAQSFQTRVQPLATHSRKQKVQRAKRPKVSQNAAQDAEKPQTHEQPSIDLAPSANFVSKFSPETPTILITPALDGRLSGERKRRIPSSIYSRMTSGATPQIDNGNVPPLPQNLLHLVQNSQHVPRIDNVPTDAAHTSRNLNGRESTGTAFEEDFDEKQLNRVTSSDTLFEEDHIPLTQESRLGHTDLKIDTAILPTPRRSRGWWDLIRTPFDNARAFKFGRSPTDGERTPEVPAIPAAVYYNQSPPYDALGLKLFPRNTHNSQALRRLESKEHLHVEPVPQFPSEYLGSGINGVSPDEREVPFMLHLSKASDQATTHSTMHRAEFSSPESNATPESSRTDFSPVGQIVAEGQVMSARGIVSHPSQPSSQISGQPLDRLYPADRSNSSSMRFSLSAEVLKTTPVIVQPPLARPESRWPSAAAPYFAPPPSFPPKNSKSYVSTKEIQVEEWLPATNKSPVTSGKTQRGWLKELFSKKGRSIAEKDKTRKKKRRSWCCCCCLLVFVLIIIGVVLGVVLSRKHKQPESTEQTWFNITGFPPIPGGPLTVVEPNLITSVSGCVDPASIWSCAVPPEQQASIKPNAPDQPNFIFNIVNGNTSYSYNDTTSNRFRPSPGPPSLDDYAFLGNTTDDGAEPFEGEATPFYMSLIESSQTDFLKVKRSNDASSTRVPSKSSATSSSNDVPDIVEAIPQPEANPDGTAQAANLLTFPSYQPIRLFNRGLATEHYGFYTYYERSIFLRSVAFQNATAERMGDVPADANGGSAESAATARCSWTDTRYKVEIWTNRSNSSSILPPLNGTTNPLPGSTTLIRPGTFPYPITITLDRHGGGLTTKMLYCYGINDQEEIIDEDKKFQPENRAFGGTISNPSVIFSSNISVSTANGGPGGIDGGTGGCKCQWANWMSG